MCDQGFAIEKLGIWTVLEFSCIKQSHTVNSPTWTVGPVQELNFRSGLVQTVQRYLTQVLYDISWTAESQVYVFMDLVYRFLSPAFILKL